MAKGSRLPKPSTAVNQAIDEVIALLGSVHAESLRLSDAIKDRFVRCLLGCIPALIAYRVQALTNPLPIDSIVVLFLSNQIYT